MNQQPSSGSSSSSSSSSGSSASGSGSSGGGPSGGVREAAGRVLVASTDWAEQHRRELVLGSLAAVTAGCGLLYRLYGVPGYTQLDARAVAMRLSLLSPHDTNGVRLPVFVRDVIPNSGTHGDDGDDGAHHHHHQRVAVVVEHAPPLLRLARTWRALTGAAAAAAPVASPSSPPPHLLQCCLAGVSDVPPAAVRLLRRQLARGSDVGGGGDKRSSPSPPVEVLRIVAATPGGTGRAGDEQLLWAELWARGLPARELRRVARHVAASAGAADSGDGGASASAAANAPAAQPWLPLRVLRRRKDVAEQLLRYGLARPVEADEELLGLRRERAQAHASAAAQAAARRIVLDHFRSGAGSTAGAAKGRWLLVGRWLRWPWWS